MALKRTLTAGWHLSDGILNTFPIGAARDVLTAAAEASFAPDPLKGMNLMAAEWVYNRRWRYESHFDAPTEDDQRVWLLFERLCGAGEVAVNGRRAASFSGGEALVEVTDYLVPGENELAVCFEAPGLRLPAENPMPLLGLAGDVWLLTGNFLALERTRSRSHGRTVAVEHRLTAFAAGKYVFSYVASRDSELARRWTFEETLPEGGASVSHALDCPDERGALDIRLDVTRSGVGCAQVRFEAIPGDEPPRRTVLVRGGRLTEAMARDLRDLGADSFCLAEEEERRLDADCLFGLKKAAPGEAFSRPACVKDLKGEAAGEAYWPPRAPLWRLRGGASPDVEALAALYGGKVLVDGELAARLTRYEQAEAVLRYALGCRQSGERAVVPLNAEWESLCSDTLTERGGRRRMAFDALKRAWRRDAAWADWPEHAAAEPGEALEIALWAATTRPGGLEATLSVSAFTLEGRCLARKKETVRVRAAERVGALTVTAPQAGVLIVRCQLADSEGGSLCRIDRVLPMKGHGAPQEALFAASASVRRSSKGALNEGAVAALAAGECLLPGEWAESASEWVNEETAAIE